MIVKWSVSQATFDKWGWCTGIIEGAVIELPLEMDPQTKAIAEALAFKVRDKGRVFHPKRSWWRRAFGR